MLHSICQQTWKTQQWPQDWKKSVFIPIPKERPFRYNLNQIPYDYTVEVRNRFKGLDLIDRVPDELWMEVRDIVQETGIKTIAKKKKCKEALQIAVKRWEVKSKAKKGKIYLFDCRVPKNSKER